MRRLILGIVVAVVVLVAVVAASVVSVPAGSGAWCRGRYLGPGVQLKMPLTTVIRYEPSEQHLGLEEDLRDSTGRVIDISVDLVFRWDFRRLPTEPVNPLALHDRFAQVLRSVDRSAPSAQVGPSAERAVRDLVRELPITAIDLQVTYPSPAVEALRAASKPTGEKVVVVGMDGLDWVLLDRLIDSGRCPTLARMRREGAWGDIVSRPPVLSPLIWTTMGTGRLPEVHGIVDFVVRDPATGKDTPITNRSREVHAFWNILSNIGVSVNLVNWWATYPAETINGVMVTERVFYQLFGIRPPLDDPANVHPPDLLPAVRSQLVEADDVTYQEVQEYANISRAEYVAAIEEARVADNPYDNRINHLRKIIAVTRGVFNVGHWLLESHPADLTVLYIEGTDTIGHRFAHFLPPKLDWVGEEDFLRYRETMARYYELCDRLLAELMEHAPADTTWIVVPDHGFYTGKARPSVLPDDFTLGAPQWHRMVGAFLASGPHIRPGKIPYIHIDDLCRTLLWLHGAPSSTRLRGKELTAMMRPEWVEAHPPRSVDDYADLPRPWQTRRAAPAGDDRPGAILDAARLAELQALGYIVDDTPSVAPPEAQPPASTELEAKATQPYNRAKMAYRNGDLAAAERLFLEALEIEPEFALAMMSLASVCADLSRHEDSLRWILRALETRSDILPPKILLDFVDEAEAADRLDRALPALDMIRARWEQSSTYFSARARVHKQLGRIDEAERELRTALAVDPADAVATEELLELATAGRPVDVEEVLRRHYAAVRTDLKRLNELSVICLRHGHPAMAERALGIVLESDPSNVGVASNMAVALQMLGKGEAAARVLERTLAERPDDGNLRFNLGAVLASLGRSEEALAHFEAAARAGATGTRLYPAQAKVLVRLGRIDEAREVLEEGARRHPNHPEIRELLAVLRSGG